MKFIIASDSLTSDYYSILYEIFNARPFNYVSKWGRIGGGETGMKILIHGSIVSILRDFILSRYSDRGPRAANLSPQEPSNKSEYHR